LLLLLLLVLVLLLLLLPLLLPLQLPAVLQHEVEQTLGCLLPQHWQCCPAEPATAQLANCARLCCLLPLPAVPVYHQARALQPAASQQSQQHPAAQHHCHCYQH
jgi:hypothetical protein